MKKLILLLFITSAATVALAQGTLNFSSFATGVNAPVTNTSGLRIVAGQGWVADLYYSTVTNAGTESFQAAGFNAPFSTLTLSGGGYFLGGARTINGASGQVVAQVRVWNLASAATYEQARAGGCNFTGSSKPLLITLGTNGGPALPMTGLQGFHLSPLTLYVYPEVLRLAVESFSTNAIKVSWPICGGPNVVLQERTAQMPNWVNSSQQVYFDGSRRFVIVPVTNESRLFRLISPFQY